MICTLKIGGQLVVKLSDFDFDLPEDLIAQTPLARRDDSRLLVLDRGASALRHTRFPEITSILGPGDVLVVNDTRVIPARLFGAKESGGRIEVFLVRRLPGTEEIWGCLTRCSKPPRPGARLLLAEGIVGTLLDVGDSDLRHIRFDVEGDFLAALERAGKIPLPPYIRREADEFDRERYQTVFAAAPGAVAAPTAGLHFTPEILDQLRHKGVEICPVTLHVGPGTFLPVRGDALQDHRMHAESYLIPETTAATVNRAKREKRRVFALGTTTTRTLEHSVGAGGELIPGTGSTDLFILPGYRFRLVDALITNFHLPCSTLLMLVSAFAGRELLLQAYRQAVAERYRFFSYGDSMVIL